MLTVIPISRDEACVFINQYHRHHVSPQGWKFGAAVADETGVVGVVMVGRPVARALDDGKTLEVIRCCVHPVRSTFEQASRFSGKNTGNAASMLYGVARKAAWALGYSKLITYILEEESGTSLKAAGFLRVTEIRGHSWNSPGRPRQDKHPTCDKVRWEVTRC